MRMTEDFCRGPRSFSGDMVAVSMNNTLWLIVAVVFAALAAYGWIKRELWIQRRRERKREQKG